MNRTKWIGTAACLLALAVILGAFGAHGLKAKLDAYHLGVYETAVFYHFIHALGLLLVAMLGSREIITLRTMQWVCSLLLAGIGLFSGSLYILAVTDMRWLGAITPFGGTAYLIAWVILAADAFSKRESP